MKHGPVIDAHAHFDCSSDEALAADHERFRRYMDEEGVVAALVMGKSVDHIDFFPEHERLIELGQKDERIFPIVNFDAPYANDACLKATESWLAEGSASAVKIYPGYDSFYPHEHPRCHEVYAMADRLGAPVVVHSGDTVTDRGRLKYARPIHLDDVAVRYPSLAIVMAHLGQPFFDEAQAVLYKNRNLRADGSGLFLSETEQFVRDFFVDELIRRLRMFFAYVGSAEKVHFGGDYPFTDPAHHLRFWELVTRELEFSKADARLLFYDNARKVFRLPVPG